MSLGQGACEALTTPVWHWCLTCNQFDCHQLSKFLSTYGNDYKKGLLQDVRTTTLRPCQHQALYQYCYHEVSCSSYTQPPALNCIKQFWWSPELNRHLTGIFWPTRFDVTIETIVSIVTSDLTGQN